MKREGTRVLFVAHSFPFPLNHGGKRDSWSILAALCRIGCQVEVLHFFGQADPVSEDVRAAASQLGVGLISVPRTSGSSRLLMAHWPPWMTSHTVSSSERSRVEDAISRFGPELVVCDTWLAFLAARAAAKRSRAPMVYRSQNVEYDYWMRIARRTPGLRGLNLWLNALLLSWAERYVRRKAAVVMDIATEDASFWERRGARGNSVVIPPLWLEEVPRADVTGRDIDVLLFGNLRLANNIGGVLWFLREVVPIVRGGHSPTLRIVVAGSQPTPEVVAACGRAGVLLADNPPDMRPWLRRARLMVNPVRFGSGVNVKMVEALSHGLFGVSTSAGVRGLPELARSQFSIADTAHEFAAAIVTAVHRTPDTSEMLRRQEVARELFGAQRIESMFAALPGTAYPITR